MRQAISRMSSRGAMVHMRRDLSWLATIVAALLSLAACVAATWYFLPGDPATRIAVGTSAGVVVGAVIALWGAERGRPAGSEEERNVADSPRQEMHQVVGSTTIQAGGDVNTGSLFDGARAVGQGAPGPTPPAGSPGTASRPPASTPAHQQSMHGVTDSIAIQAAGNVTVERIEHYPLPPQGTITAVVNAYVPDPPELGWTMASPMRHEGSFESGHLTIAPAHPYVDHVRSEGKLTPLTYEESRWERDFLPATLDVKVANNTGRTILLHHVQLDVAWSKPGGTPIPYVWPINIDPRGRIDVKRLVDLIGDWQNSILRFHLELPDRAGALTREYQVEHPHLSGAGALLAEALAEAGAHFVNPRERGTRDSPWAWDLGPFDRSTALLVGTLEYTNARHENQRRISHDVQFPVTFQAIDDFSISPSATYHPPTVLRADEPDGYVVDLPIAHVLAHGEADRFLISLSGENHSQHDFQVILHHDQGVLNCGRVSLDLFELHLGIPDPDRFIRDW